MRVESSARVMVVVVRVGEKLLKRAAIDFNPYVPTRARLVPLQRLDRCECIGWKIIITESQRKRKRKKENGGEEKCQKR